MNTDLTVVVRSAGERTLSACCKILESQVTPAQIFTVEEKPFSAAVKKTFAIGLEQGRRWTLAIDADVLVIEDCVGKMLEKAESLEGHFFIYQGYVFDKIFDDFRSGGPHLYRTAHLTRAMDFIPAEGESMRPESHTYHKMAEEGYHYYHDIEVYGLHDFEQHHDDLFRKGFFQARKHRFMLDHFMKRMVTGMESDDDLVACFWGMVASLLDDEEVKVDRDFFARKLEQYRTFLTLSKKDALKELLISPEEIIAREVIDKNWTVRTRYPEALIRRSDKEAKVPLSSRVYWKLGSWMQKKGNRFISKSTKRHF